MNFKNIDTDIVHSSKAYAIIDHILDTLVSEKDIVETTTRHCIVYYIIGELYDNNLLLDPTFEQQEVTITSNENRVFYPYKKSSVLWKAMSKTLKNLTSNNDVIERTNHDYIVTYILNELSNHGIIE